ncbi:MAG: GTP-binding protein [Dehalococcoidia bacterium]|nr:GTP-binding protein [Dehalococcoidia bacterium]
MDLLRFATAGSVDDGKSTLIGRLLYDSKQVFEDTLDSLKRSTAGTNFDDEVNLALLTDGLRAEREQGITIDVAYRYFATPKRKFIIADSPGHVQYTRNMITGASTADLTLILVDARNGVVEQTRRHAAIAALLGIRHVVLCVNKMDLVDFDQARFASIVRDFEFVQETVGLERVTPIPISALTGDNVVERSSAMPWFEGAPLLEFLEDVPIPSPAAAGPFRFPVQYVIRPQTKDLHDYRGYAGTILGGRVKSGDAVVVLPGGQRSTVESVDFAGEPLEAGEIFQAATIRLADDVDAGRGSIIADAAHPPTVTRELVADLCWMSEASALKPRQQFLLKTSTQRVKAMVTTLVDRLDIESLERVGEPSELALNGLARVVIRTADPVAVDPYRKDRWTGSFILIDPATFATVAAGMVRETDTSKDAAAAEESVYA